MVYTARNGVDIWQMHCSGSLEQNMRRQLKLGGKGSQKDPNKPGSNRRLNGDFRGMILERLSGKTLDEELAARRSGVQDVHFLREVLYQVRHILQRQVDIRQQGFLIDAGRAPPSLRLLCSQLPWEKPSQDNKKHDRDSAQVVSPLMSALLACLCRC